MFILETRGINFGDEVAKILETLFLFWRRVDFGDELSIMEIIAQSSSVMRESPKCRQNVNYGDSRLFFVRNARISKIMLSILEMYSRVHVCPGNIYVCPGNIYVCPRNICVWTQVCGT